MDTDTSAVRTRVGGWGGQRGDKGTCVISYSLKRKKNREIARAMKWERIPINTALLGDRVQCERIECASRHGTVLKSVQYNFKCFLLDHLQFCI